MTGPMMRIIHRDCMTTRLCTVILRFGRFTAKTGYIYSKITAASLIRKKTRLYNKEITAYYIHWASKFATMITKHKQTADYIQWASKIATSATKHADKIIYKTDNTSIEFKKG